jgi:5'(3')-deoxyribonucleotidase
MSKFTKIPCLGIDFGGVIIPKEDFENKEDTDFPDNLPEKYLQKQPFPYSFEAIKHLVSLFNGNVWIISKAGSKIEQLSRNWLTYYNFFETTGVLVKNIRFCREREEKLIHCTELKITHFIDDRIHIMQILQGTVEQLYLFGPQKGNQKSKWWIWVMNWNEASDAIINSL